MITPQVVDRKEELSIVKKIISEKSERGQLISLIGLHGIGKRTFFRMLKDEFEEDNQTLCLMDNVLSADTTLTFFERLFSNFESKIHPKKQKFKNFFKTYADAIHLIVNVGLAATGIPAGSSISKLISVKDINTLPSLESELISMMRDFEKNFPNQKLVILIGDMDTSDHINDFISIFEDVTENLSKNVTIMVSSAEKIVESDIIVPLQKFDEESIKEFVRKNIPTIKEENLNQIVEKSGGYPLALHWLWENYRRGVDINSLLLRLPREGFLQQLQANFLDNLDEDEVKVMKICAALDIIDSRIVSKVSGLEQQNVNEVLEYLSLSSVLIQINYQQLTNKQNIEIYILDETFRNLVHSSFGTDVDINKQVLQYYIDALNNGLYPIRNFTIGRIVNQLEEVANSINPKITPQHVLLNIDLDVLKKFDISSEIVSYYWMGNKKEKIKDFVAIQFELARNISNPNYKKLYDNQAVLNKLLVEEKYHEAKKLCEDTATWLDSFDKNEMSTLEKENITKAIEYMKAFGDFLISKEDHGESILQALLGKDKMEKFTSLSNNKIFQCGIMIQTLEELITAQNFEGGIEIGEECLKILSSITDKDKEEFEKLNNSKIPEWTLQLLEYAAKYDLGNVYLLKVFTLMLSKNYDKIELRSSLEKAVVNLEVSKSDPVRGKFYYDAKRLLDEWSLDS